MPTDRPRLVFGDDRSPTCDMVWSWIDQQPWPGWQITAVTAELPPAPPLPPDRYRPHSWAPAAPRKLTGTSSDTPVEHLFAEADPRVVLDSFTDAALLVIGPRGKGLLKHLHLGSTAEWLVSAHRPLVPLLVVRAARPTRRVVCCVDGSDHALEAVRSFARLPLAAACGVTVLGVDDGRSRAEAGVQQAAELLEAASVRSVDQRLVQSTSPTASLDTRGVIFDVLDETGPELVVLGTRGLSSWRRLVVGSVTSAVVHHSRCSVLVARGESHDGLA